MDGVISNATGVTRRWLLDSVLKSTAVTWVATSIGELVLEVTATGPGGSATATSAPVNIASTGTPTPSSTLFGPRGFNVGFSQLDFTGTGFPFINRAKTSSEWRTVDGPNYSPEFGGDNRLSSKGATNTNRMPISLAGSSAAEKIINVEGSHGPAGVTQRYVIETSRADATINVAATIISDKVLPNGKRRIVFDPGNNPSFTDGNSYGVYVRITALPTPFSMSDTFDCWRLDEEAGFRAGKLFTDQFKARFAQVDVIRFMDWTPANRTNVTTWSQRPTLTWDMWNSDRGVPIEVQIALCNETKCHGWFHIPVTVDDDYVAKLGAALQSGLNADLLRGIEFGNEDWNSSFPQYGYLAYLQPYVDTGLSNPADYERGWTMTGYLASQKVAKLLKAVDFDHRYIPLWGTLGVSIAVSNFNRRGINIALSEWAKPDHANYDPVLAARFDRLGKLWRGGLQITAYFTGGMSQQGLDSASKDIIYGWATATDNSGYESALRQLDAGDLLPWGDGNSYAGFSRVMGDSLALAQAEQIPVGVYEGNVELDAQYGWTGDARRNVVQEFFNRLYDYAGMRSSYAKALRTVRLNGIYIYDILTDFGTRGDPYATNYGAYSGKLTQRALGLQDYAASPGPGKPLQITSITTDGGTTVGSSPITKIMVTGGVGQVTVTVTDLVPGRSFDGFREIRGAFTQQTTETVIATVTATDQADPPNVVTATFDQSVGPSVTYTTGRYLRFEATEICNPGARLGYGDLDYIGIIAADNTEHSATWTGNNDRAPTLASDDGQTYFSGDPLASGPWRAQGDLGAQYTVKSIPMAAAVNNYNSCPGNFKLWIATKADRSDEVLLLNINEPDTTNWNAHRRVFPVST